MATPGFPWGLVLGQFLFVPLWLTQPVIAPGSCTTWNE